MLGNVDEYGEVEVPGEQGTRDYITNPSDTIMAVSVNNPVERHYYLIKWAAEKILGKEGLAEVVPYMQGRIGNRPAMPIISLSQVQEARSQLGSSAPARAPYPTSKSTGMQSGAHPSAHLPSSRPAPASAKSSPPASASSSAPASSQSGAVARPAQQSTRPLPVPKQSQPQPGKQGERPLLVPKQSQPQPSKQSTRPLPSIGVPTSASSSQSGALARPAQQVVRPPNVGASASSSASAGPSGASRSAMPRAVALTGAEEAAHEIRRKKILLFIDQNLSSMREEQGAILQKHNDWYEKPGSSKLVVELLGL